MKTHSLILNRLAALGMTLLLTVSVARAQDSTGFNVTWVNGSGDGVWNNSSVNWLDPSLLNPAAWQDGFNAVFLNGDPATVTVSGSFNVGANKGGNNNYLQITGTYTFAGDPLYFTAGNDNKIYVKGPSRVVFDNRIYGTQNFYIQSNDGNSLITFTGGVISGNIETSNGVEHGNKDLTLGEWGGGNMTLASGTYLASSLNIRVDTQRQVTVQSSTIGVRNFNVQQGSFVFDSPDAVLRQTAWGAVKENKIGQSNNAAWLVLNSGTVALRGGLAVMIANRTFENAGNQERAGTLTVTGGVLNLNDQNGLTLGYAEGDSGKDAAFNASLTGKAVANISGGVVNAKAVIFGGGDNDNINNGNNLLRGFDAANSHAELNLSGGVLAISSGGIVTGTINQNAGVPGSVTREVTMGHNTINLSGGTLKALDNFSVQAGLPLTLSGSNGGVKFDTNGKTITVNSGLTGSGTFTKAGAGTLLLTAAANTYSGDAVIAAGTLEIAAGASLALDTLTFALDGLNVGSVTGAGALTLNAIAFDMTNAGAGGSWDVSNIFGTLTPVWNSGFNISDWTNSGGNIWTSNDGLFSFDWDHFLITAIPEPSTWALLLTGAALLAVCRRKK